LAAVLADLMPKRLAQRWLTQAGFAQQGARRIAELGRRDLARLVERLLDWQVSPTGTEGYRKAEVTAGGVATDELNARSLQSLRVPGLYFIGEVVDVTGWLGGYNFQWAWSSGWSAGQALGRTSG
jgi:predicted Rossmann fold flavoprotein